MDRSHLRWEECVLRASGKGPLLFLPPHLQTRPDGRDQREPCGVAAYDNKNKQRLGRERKNEEGDTAQTRQINRSQATYLDEPAAS